MKNYFIKVASLFILTIGFTSCTSENSIESEVDTNYKLPVSYSETNYNSYDDSESVFAEEYLYDNNKLSEIKLIEDGVDFGYIKLIYNGDKVVRIDTYNELDVIEEKTSIEYNGNNIVKVTSYEGDESNVTYIEEFVYDSQDRIIEKSFTEYYDNIVYGPDVTTYEYINDNSLKATTSENEYKIIEFDSKFSPYSDIPNLSSFIAVTEYPLLKNVISIKEYYDDVLSYEKNFTNTYDSDDFLTKQVITFSDNSSETKEYTYNR